MAIGLITRSGPGMALAAGTPPGLLPAREQMALLLAGPAQYVEAEWGDEPTMPADEERVRAVSTAPRIKLLTPPTDSSPDQRRNRLFGLGYVDLLAGDDVGV